jgi:hypothetical protein
MKIPEHITEMTGRKLTKWEKIKVYIKNPKYIFMKCYPDAIVIDPIETRGLIIWKPKTTYLKFPKVKL